MVDMWDGTLEAISGRCSGCTAMVRESEAEQNRWISWTLVGGKVSLWQEITHRVCLFIQPQEGDRWDIIFVRKKKKKTTSKVAKNRYFIICAKSLLENMNSNETEKTLKEIRGKVPDAQTEAECGPKSLRQLGNYGLWISALICSSVSPD